VYVPGVVSTALVRVSVDVKSGAPVSGWNDVVTPAGIPEALSCTVLVLPDVRVSEKAYVAVSPAVTFASVGPLAVSEKSNDGGGGTELTTKVAVVVCVTPPPLPTIVSGYDPVGVLVCVPRISVAENVGFAIAGLKLAVTPTGNVEEIDKVMGVVAPPLKFTFTV
jgi:hypothetical protein